MVVLVVAGGRAIRADAEGAPAPAVAPSTQKARRLRKNMRQLWRENIQSLPRTGGAADLRRTISRVRSIRLSEESAVPPTKPAAKATTAPAKSTRPVLPVNVKKQAPRRGLSAEVLEKLRKLPKGAGDGQMALADMLFEDERYASAMVLYDRVLSAAQDEDTKAWALFQKANCLKGSDPSAALELYRQLASEYAESIWSPLGAAQGRLLQWKRQHKPAALLDAADEQVRSVVATGKAKPKASETTK